MLTDATRGTQATVAPTPTHRAPDPVEIAARILAGNSTAGRRDIAGIARELGAISARDTILGGEVRTAVEARLTPVERGQLASAAYSLAAPDGATIVFKPDAPSVADYRGMAAGTGGRAFYDRLDRLWGDGNGRTDDTARIEAGLQTLRASGGTLETAEAAKAEGSASPGADVGKVALDLSQIALDIVGIFEPTPFADGSNAVISAFRGNWLDAGLSAAGILPYVGDLAKLGKLGSWANKVSNAIELAASNPAARQALEPALRKIADALRAIPAGALDKLPAEARATLEGLRTKIDDAFAAVAPRRLADIPPGELTRKSILDNLDTLDVSTPRDAAVFYSGRGAREAAEAHARATGRATLESTSGGGTLDNLKLFDGKVPDVDDVAATDIWGRVSTRYAEQASGRVKAFINNPRDASVFLTRELPALLANGNVTEVVVRSVNGRSATIAAGTPLDAALKTIADLSR